MGLFEIIIILAVALIVLGPERMPDMVRMLVQIVREVRTAANDAMREITEAIEQESPPNQALPSNPDASAAAPQITRPLDQENPSTQAQSAATPAQAIPETKDAAADEHISNPLQSEHSPTSTELQPDQDQAQPPVEKA